MDNIHKRIILFSLCIIIRLLISVYMKDIKKQYLPIFGVIALMISFGFIYIYINDLRKTGLEVFGDKIWWNHLRPLHSLLYALFGILAIMKNKHAWIFLFVDVLIGSLAFIHFHFLT